MSKRNRKGKVTTKRVHKKKYNAHVDTKSPIAKGRFLTKKRNALQTNHSLRVQKICTNRTIINTSLFLHMHICIYVCKNETCR